MQAEQIYPLFLESPIEGASKTYGQLFEEICRTASDMPHCYVVAVQDSACIHALHRAAVFQFPLGGKVEEWHNKIMIFNGDVCTVPNVPANVHATSVATGHSNSLQGLLVANLHHAALHGRRGSKSDGLHCKRCPSGAIRRSVNPEGHVGAAFAGSHLPCRKCCNWASQHPLCSR
jgi:hypothetical protein